MRERRETAAPQGAGYLLRDGDDRPYRSPEPGRWGGHRRLKLYGCLDCPSALRALARGHYAAYRVFFRDRATAVRAGYRPCAVCLPDAYRHWRARRGQDAS
ncbi:metal-binding protein [Streptomyces sp. NPDC088785]|uniref:metal-binding protein n=1 Tax=Streptomyces sp. NPDC088785 TaxID=3365897 RepID=UPI00380B7700